jgi:hypothetical protein
MDRRDIGTRDAGEALSAVWFTILTTSNGGEFRIGRQGTLAEHCGSLMPCGNWVFGIGMT